MPKLLASGSRTFITVDDGSTVTPLLLPSTGDLIQTYTGPYDAPTSINPDWSPSGTGTTNLHQPTVKFKVVSSNLETGILYPKRVWWYLDDEELQFDANGVSKAPAGSSLSAFDGCFERIDADSATGTLPALRIVNNLVVASNGADMLLMAQGATDASATDPEYQAVTQIQINAVTASDFMITIYPVSGDLSITEHGGSVTLGVRAAQGTTPLRVYGTATGAPSLPGIGIGGQTGVMSAMRYYSVEWFVLDAAGDWVSAGSGADTLTIGDSEVQTELAVRAVLVENNKVAGTTPVAYTSVARASDKATVYDDTDPMMILIATQPEDATFRPGKLEEFSVYPVLTTRDFSTAGVGGTSPAGIPAHEFHYQIFDQYGDHITNRTAVGKIPYTEVSGKTIQADGIVLKMPSVREIEVRFDAQTLT